MCRTVRRGIVQCNRATRRCRCTIVYRKTRQNWHWWHIIYIVVPHIRLPTCILHLQINSLRAIPRTQLKRRRCRICLPTRPTKIGILTRYIMCRTVRGRIIQRNCLTSRRRCSITYHKTC